MRKGEKRINDKLRYFINLGQDELDQKSGKKIADETGEISREDSFKFAVDTNIFGFGCVMGDFFGDNKQFHEVKSLSKTVSNNKDQNVGKVYDN